MCNLDPAFVAIALGVCLMVVLALTSDWLERRAKKKKEDK